MYTITILEYKEKYLYEKSRIGNGMLLKMLKITETQSQKLIFTCFYRLNIVEYNLNYIITEKGKLIEKLGRKTTDLRFLHYDG